MDQTDQGLGAVWREKSFGQRLKFGAGGGKFVPLGPRTIFLDRPKRPIQLPIIRKSPFLDLLGLAFTGFIMKYILPPGTGGRGRILRGGRGAGDVGEEIKEFWSMTRHEWGDIHFYLAALFVVLMVVHIILHWNWIKSYFKSLLGFSRKTTER